MNGIILLCGKNKIYHSIVRSIVNVSHVFGDFDAACVLTEFMSFQTYVNLNFRMTWKKYIITFYQAIFLHSLL